MLYLPDSLDYAVVRIGAFVVAVQSLEPGVFGETQRQAILDSELLKLANDAVSDDGDALSKEAVHSVLEYVQFVLD